MIRINLLPIRAAKKKETALQQIVMSSLNLVSVMMIGQLGETAVAAVGLARGDAGGRVGIAARRAVRFNGNFTGCD